MRYFFLALLLSAVLVVGFAGFRGDKFSHTPLEILPDMDQQAKVKPQGENAFFADGVGARKPVVGTVPMGLSVPTKSAAEGGFADYGFSHGGGFYDTGAVGDTYGDGFPEQIQITEGFLRLGKERYNINCAICHGISGNGAGVTSKYGMLTVANLHGPSYTDPKAADYRSNGNIFHTITVGRGLMGAYGPNIPVKERWAIIAWIRTLQMSRHAPLSDESVKAAWSAHAPAVPAAATTASAK